jgi:hypothetical protein
MISVKAQNFFIAILAKIKKIVNLRMNWKFIHNTLSKLKKLIKCQLCSLGSGSAPKKFRIRPKDADPCGSGSATLIYSVPVISLWNEMPPNLWLWEYWVPTDSKQTNLKSLNSYYCKYALVRIYSTTDNENLVQVFLKWLFCIHNK